MLLREGVHSYRSRKAHLYRGPFGFLKYVQYNCVVSRQYYERLGVPRTVSDDP